MVKAVNIPPTQPLYEHAPNQFRPWAPPAPGGLPRYTLKPALGPGEIGGPPTYLGAFIPSDGGIYNGIEAACWDDRCIIHSGSQAGRLFFTGKQQGSNSGPAVAECAIPALVTGTNINALNVATMTQQFRTMAPMVSAFGDSRLMGLGLVDGQLIAGGVSWYDNSGRPQNYSIFRDAGNLAASALLGMLRVTGGRHNAGWTIPIPAALQSAFGATHLQGHGGGISIESTTVSGVSFFAVNAADILAATTPEQVITAVALADYNVVNGEGMAGNLYTSPEWNWLSVCGGAFFVPGTRTIMGIGHGWIGTDIDPDPLNTIKYKDGVVTDIEGNSNYGGYFAYKTYNYQNRYWLWDADDLIAVRNGERPANSVRPYEFGPLDNFPFCDPYRRNNLIGGAALLPDNTVAFSTQRGAQSRFTASPTVGVLQLAGI